MYERNAIVIDRYFADIFGYVEKNNLKSNFENYHNLVEKLERFQEVSNSENDMMEQFERVANEIKESQRLQEIYHKRNLKLQEARKSLFNHVDENIETLTRKFNKLDDELLKNNAEIKANVEKYISEVSEFHEKTELRTQCGRDRRTVEDEYQKALNNTINNFNGINLEIYNYAKKFVKQEQDVEVKDLIPNPILIKNTNNY